MSSDIGEQELGLHRELADDAAPPPSFSEDTRSKGGDS